MVNPPISIYFVRLLQCNVEFTRFCIQSKCNFKVFYYSCSQILYFSMFRKS